MISISGGLPSIVESIYLGEELGSYDGCSDIIVNPLKTKYLTGKVVIINDVGYDSSEVETLRRNGCKVISRVSSVEGDTFQPYLIRICYDVMWNGDTLERLPSVIKADDIVLGRSEVCRLKLPDYKLFFPKIERVRKEELMDHLGNLSWLGWVLHQVGINLKEGTDFKDLDVIKTGKIHL